MSAVAFFLGAIAADLGATALAVGILRRPLAEMLAELCGSRARGEFWVTLATLCMLLAAPAASMLPDASLRHPATNGPPLLLNAITQCVCGLVGVLISLLSVAGALFVFIRRFEICSRGSAASGHEGAMDPLCSDRRRSTPPVRHREPEDTLRRLLRRKHHATHGG